MNEDSAEGEPREPVLSRGHILLLLHRPSPGAHRGKGPQSLDIDGLLSSHPAHSPGTPPGGWVGTAGGNHPLQGAGIISSGPPLIFSVYQEEEQLHTARTLPPAIPPNIEAPSFVCHHHVPETVRSPLRATYRLHPGGPHPAPGTS